MIGSSMNFPLGGGGAGVQSTFKYCYERLDKTIKGRGSLITLAFICFQALDLQPK